MGRKEEERRGKERRGEEKKKMERKGKERKGKEKQIKDLEFRDAQIVPRDASERSWPHWPPFLFWPPEPGQRGSQGGPGSVDYAVLRHYSGSGKVH